MDEAENRDAFMKLADELEALKNGDKFAEVIGNLRALEYDDFANTRFAAPKMQMANDFHALGREDIVKRVHNGDFDQ